MAKFIKVEYEVSTYGKHVGYINLDNVSVIQDDGDGTTVYFVGGADDYVTYNIPLTDFMDLVNSQK